jgi:hypothetical protein
VVFAGLPSRTQLQAISGRQGDSGPTYLYARIRPQLKVETGRPFAEHAVFMLDTSLSEHPDRFAVSMKLWQQILQSDPGIKKFNILAFNVGTSWIESKGWLDNTPEGRAKALARLDGVVLEGATDLSAVLAQLCVPQVARHSVASFPMVRSLGAIGTATRRWLISKPTVRIRRGFIVTPLD